VAAPQRGEDEIRGDRRVCLQDVKDVVPFGTEGLFLGYVLQEDALRHHGELAAGEEDV